MVLVIINTAWLLSAVLLVDQVHRNGVKRSTARAAWLNLALLTVSIASAAIYIDWLNAVVIAIDCIIAITMVSLLRQVHLVTR